MDLEQEKLIYQLYKKGKENLSGFDILLLEANPEMKEELTRLFNVDERLYKKCDRNIEETHQQQHKKNKTIFNFQSPLIKLIPAAIAACLLILFIWLPGINTPSVALGGKTSLFITNKNAPDRFYPEGSHFQPEDALQLSFQPPAETESIRQGVIFSISGEKKTRVYYRYNSSLHHFDQREQTIVEKELKLPEEEEYHFFIAYFSGSTFDEDKLIESITSIIRKEGTGAEKTLLKKYKNDIMDFIYLSPQD